MSTSAVGPPTAWEPVKEEDIVSVGEKTKRRGPPTAWEPVKEEDIVSVGD